MGLKGQEITGVDIKILLEMLNRAYADEWLAYYQYWIGAKIAQGMVRHSLVKELEEHAQDELKHASMLASRIITLGGTPLTHPKAWFENTKCGFHEPKDPNTRKLLEQNLTGERCAILFYQEILNFVKGKDSITFNMIRKILEDEVEHEEDLEAFQKDFAFYPSK